MGILGANLLGIYNKKYSFGLVGNTISGVFGCIFIIKSFGRLGFNPQAILSTGNINFALFILNAIISISSGALALVLISKLNKKFNPKTKD